MNSLRPIFLFTAMTLLIGLACATVVGGVEAPTQTPQPVQDIPTETPPEPNQMLPTESISTADPFAPTDTPATFVSNVYMATDELGIHQTIDFSPTDDFYIIFHVGGIESGTNFQSRWYVLTLEGEDPNVPFQIIDYVYEEGIARIYFQLTSAEPWPAGTYRVEVYMDGTEVGEQEFSVQ